MNAGRSSRPTRWSPGRHASLDELQADTLVVLAYENDSTCRVYQAVGFVPPDGSAHSNCSY